MWEQLYVQLDKLDQLAQEIIQKEIPQDESCGANTNRYYAR